MFFLPDLTSVQNQWPIDAARTLKGNTTGRPADKARLYFVLYYCTVMYCTPVLFLQLNGGGAIADARVMGRLVRWYISKPRQNLHAGNAFQERSGSTTLRKTHASETNHPETARDKHGAACAACTRVFMNSSFQAKKKPLTSVPFTNAASRLGMYRAATRNTTPLMRYIPHTLTTSVTYSNRQNTDWSCLGRDGNKGTGQEHNKSGDGGNTHERERRSRQATGREVLS